MILREVYGSIMWLKAPYDFRCWCIWSSMLSTSITEGASAQTRLSTAAVSQVVQPRFDAPTHDELVEGAGHPGAGLDQPFPGHFSAGHPSPRWRS